MKKFIKENWFKIGILMLFLILIIVLCFIFLFSKDNVAPIKNNITDTKYLELSKQCKTDSQKNLEEDIDYTTREKYKDDVSNCYYLEPRYLFSKKLNTCLYYGGYTCDLKKIKEDGFMKGFPVKRWSKHIVDVYTNKTIIDVYVEDSSNVSEFESGWIDDFNNKYEELGF